jgi:hypothetical protein
MMKSTAPTRYIKCRRKVLQYANLKAAESALPRVRRSDPTARLVSEEEEYELLRTTPSTDVVTKSR